MLACDSVKVNLLDFEVICSETGVVDLKHVASVVCNPVKDLQSKMRIMITWT